MICDKCGRRFGSEGKNYWDAKKGLCQYCNGNKSHESFF